MNARSTSLGNSKSLSRTSISTTSEPNERSAFDTPRPVASETSRSEPGPPMRTAIFFGRSLISFRLPDNFNFSLQFDPAFCPRRTLYLVDQLKHFCCSRAAIVHNEIAVHLRHSRISDARILQTQFIHQLSRWNARGVLKNAPCALGDWLRSPSFLLRFAQATIDLCALGRLRAERRRNRKIIFQQRKSPVKNLQLVSIFHVQLAFRVEITNPRDALESLSAHRSGVHAQRTTDYARDSFHPFESAEICRARRVSNFPQLHACARGDFGAVDLDFLEVSAAWMNHHTADATVAYKKIRAATHCEKRQVFIPAKPNQIRKGFFVSRLDPKLCRPAYAQRGVFRERLVKADVPFFADDRLQLFGNHQIRRQDRQLLMNVAST